MSIFRDIAEVIYEAYEANERWNAEVDKYHKLQKKTLVKDVKNNSLKKHLNERRENDIGNSSSMILIL